MIDDIQPPLTSAETRPDTRPIWRWLDVALITVASIGIIVLGTLGVSYYAQFRTPVLLSEDSLPLIYNAALAAVEVLALVGGVYIFGMRRRRLSWRQLGFLPSTPGWLLASLAVAAAFIPLLGLIAVLIQKMLGQPIQNPQLQFLVPEGFSWPGALAMLLIGGIAAPFAEELYFRGVIYRWLRDNFGPWIAAPTSALVFGALHGDIAIAGASFVIGLVLAWFYERTRSLWPSVLIHIANNSIKLLLLYLMIALGVDPLSL
jgi:membrane protease YdiL (CAAX protease family)